VIATVVQGEGNDKKWVAYCPKSSDHKTFETTTVVNQDWLVDEQGDYFSTVDDCSPRSSPHGNPGIRRAWLNGVVPGLRSRLEADPPLRRFLA
jgi:hypothetical protein